MRAPLHSFRRIFHPPPASRLFLCAVAVISRDTSTFETLLRKTLRSPPRSIQPQHSQHTTFFEPDASVTPTGFFPDDPPGLPFRLFGSVFEDDEVKVGEEGTYYNEIDWEDTNPGLALERSVSDDDVATMSPAAAVRYHTGSSSFKIDMVLAALTPAPFTFLWIFLDGRLDDRYV
ncbi:hypothetical protein EI94DRAFT_1708870 [Lactarius quietus]|nr:hypothetical protein EI94DRAFT_1708870 [Lactarius quietus]